MCLRDNLERPVSRCSKDSLRATNSNDARAMIGWQFWIGPIMFSVACVGTGYVASTGEPVALRLFILFSIITIVLWTLRLRLYKKFTADIDHRTVEVLEGAPQRFG